MNIRPIDPQTLQNRPVQERKTPLNFEYVLLFFSLEKETLWTATMVASTVWPIGHPDHERHSNNLYQFAYRKGIHESHDNERSGKEPVMWDSDSWLHALNPSDYNKGVAFFRKLWTMDQRLKAQGRNCSYNYCNQDGLVIIEEYAAPNALSATNTRRVRLQKPIYKRMAIPILVGILILAAGLWIVNFRISSTQPTQQQDEANSGVVVERRVYFPSMIVYD